MITDDTPRHNARAPSVEDIRVKAFPIPVYTAAGEVANTCIRVYSAHISVRNGETVLYGPYKLTLMLSTGNITACSVIPA